jgi:N-acetyl-alpha-D-glucosaminyl L-malate synthase BshA
MLEVARQIAEAKTKPRRSIAFIGFDMEERMLWGSRWFAAHMPWPVEQVKFFITADMIGRSLGVKRHIEVIPNFLDCTRYRRSDSAALRQRYARDESERIVIHMSNFRPVKRAEAVIEVFSRIAAAVPARLLLVGDGPDLSKAIDRAQQLGVGERVEALGEQDQVVPLLSISDLFLLPSQQESFGLAALEAMACRVPVVASAVGGLSEVIEHGRTGFLHDVDDLDGMAASGILLLSDPGLHAAIAASGRRTVKERFCADLIVPRYETFYEELLR